MLDFEEELKKFQPSLEVEDIEKAIYQEDLTDKVEEGLRIAYGLYNKAFLPVHALV